MLNTQFLIFLALLSVVTSLIMECVKKFKTDFADNLAVLIISIIVTFVGFAFYVLYKNLTITPLLITEGIVVAIFVWLCSTLGYDKVIETVKHQLANTTNDADNILDTNTVYADEPDEESKVSKDDPVDKSSTTDELHADQTNNQSNK